MKSSFLDFPQNFLGIPRQSLIDLVYALQFADEKMRLRMV
jgi:hypothetical protein